MWPAELIARVERLLLSPAAEWDSIDNEGADVPHIYQSYILPLVGIAALARFLGMAFTGVLLVGWAVKFVVVSAGVVYVMALIINALAPQFGAKQDFGQAFKLAAYAPTASWVGTMFLILPMLWFMALIGAVYSLYLLFVGLPKLMKPAADKAMMYSLAVIGCTIVVGIVAFAIIARVG